MHVLLINDYHHPTGGAEKYFFELKNRLKQQPDTQVYSIGFGNEEQKGDDFYVLPAAKNEYTRLLWRSLLHPLIYLKLRRAIREFQPDVIHIHNIKQYPASLLRALRGYPIVQTMHDFSYICPTAQNIHRDQQPCATGIQWRCVWQHHVKHSLAVYLALLPSFYQLRRQLKKTVHTFIAPSPLLTDYLERHQFHAAVCVMPFLQQRNTVSFTAMQPQHFLYAGNLGKHKGVHLLIEEFARALHINPALTLAIAGTGPEENHLRERVRELNIGNQVRFLGWIDDLSSHYESACAVIFPSIGLESFGLVVTDAMSHARPVLGVNRGTTAWLVEDGKTGLLFDPLKPLDLASKLVRLAADPRLCQTLGMGGYEKLQGMIDNEGVVQKMMGIYRQVSCKA